MRRTAFHSGVCLWTAFAVITGGCHTPPSATPKRPPIASAPTPAPATASPSTGRPQVPIVPDPDGTGTLTAKLADTAVTASTAQITPLSAADTQALLARLEPLPTLDNSKAPPLRAPSLAPPRAGSVLPIAFVKPTGKAVSDAPISQAPAALAPLMPPQILPIGDVRAEEEIRVRFDEPMVPVGQVGKDVPSFITITPAVEGSWRWVDTRVAQFTVKAARLPGATEFKVRVGPGVKAVSGSVLAAEQVGTFRTPPVMINGLYPNVTVRPDSPLLIEFDQDIDQDAIAKLLRVEDAAKHKLPFKTITLEAAQKLWAKNPSVKDDKRDLPKHYVIVAPQTAWRPGMQGRVVLAAKAPSKEGPRLSVEQTGAEFEVAKPFVTVGIVCDNKKPFISGGSCSAWSYAEVTFSNNIYAPSYHAKDVQIEGELDDNTQYGTWVGIETPHDIGASHTIVISGKFTDAYGQPLEGPRRLPFTVIREIYEPMIAADSGFYILDPRYQIPQWEVSTQAIGSLHVSLYKVEPKDYFAYQDFEAGKRPTPPGKRVYDKTDVVGARYAATAHVDLRPALSTAGTGHVIAVAESEKGAKDKRVGRAVAWIQVTRLGITARFDSEKVNAWTVDISPTGFMKPIAGASTSLLVENRSDAAAPVKTEADGHAAFDMLPRADRKKGDEYPTSLIVSEAGGDSVFTMTGGRYQKAQRERTARWYVTDDRFTYKPGENVYVKGWIRWSDSGVNPDIALPPSGDKIQYTLTDARGNRVGSGEAKLSAQGGFDLEMALPSNVNLGVASFRFETASGEAIHLPISIEEFRTPAYAVNLVDDVTHAGAAPLVVGESIEMSAEAKYYAGGGLAGSAIKWNAVLEPASYRPPGWDRYSFTPPSKRSARDSYYREYGSAISASEETTLSGASTSGLTLAIGSLPGHVPGVLSVDSTVTDIDRQTIRASSRRIVVHPSALYIGVRLQPDNEVEDRLQFVVTDIDGNLVPDVPVAVDIEGVLGSDRYKDDAEVVDTQHCALTSAKAPVTCGFKRKKWDIAYTAIAHIADSRNRPNAAELQIPWWSWPDADLSVVSDKQLYKPGDVAKLEIRSKVVPATAIVTFGRQGVMAQKRVELRQPSTTFELPIQDAYVENVVVDVDRLGKRTHTTKGSTLPLPDQAHAELDIPVDVESARLVMKTRATQLLVEPGENATFEVSVQHDDKPLAGAEVALIVVDEAVLAISGKSHPDPLAPFYRAVAGGSWEIDSFDLVRDRGDSLNDQIGFERINLDEPGRGHGTGTGYGVGSGRGGMRGRSASAPSVSIGAATVKARKDFRPTAVFSPTLTTDENGKATVTVKMPDSLTRFRIVAIATAKTRYFGKAESSIVTQLKVNARTVAPRFLTQGDTFALPVVVQNLDKAPRTIDVAVRAANLATTGVTGKRVVVPAGQRAEVRFDMATVGRGKSVIQTIVSSGSFADASNVEVPVYEPATTESFATYGSLDDKPQFERLAVPADIFKDVGGVETEVSSTQMQELTDAFWYLYAYPFECAEQRSSRMLATSFMYDILDAFSTGAKPTRDELVTTQKADIARLTRDQNADGGWGYFKGMDTDPFVSMQVLRAFAAQKEKGAATQKALVYVNGLVAKNLAALEQELKRRDIKIVNHVDKDSYPVGIAAFGLATIAATGTDVTAKAARLDELATKLDAYPVDAKAQVLAMLAGNAKYKVVRDKLLATLLSAVHETASSATVAATYTEEERLLIVSNTRTNALVLDALLKENAQQPLVAKLARGVLDSRKRGRWMSTQDNLAVLAAMRHYFDIYEKDTPNFTGKVWIGTAAYLEQTYAGRSNARATAMLDWSQLAPGSTHDIAMTKSGPGRMYYRIGITYAPKQTNLPALDAGFIVRRSYEAVDRPSDVTKGADGTWHVKLGARVLVTVETLNTAERHGVAVVDPLPAGFEAVNTHLATSERAVNDPRSDWWQYTNMRDNRSEVFRMNLESGTHRFSYTARATTPGTFLAAPAKAEEMYSPETFGRSTGATVVVQ